LVAQCRTSLGYATSLTSWTQLIPRELGFPARRASRIGDRVSAVAPLGQMRDPARSQAGGPTSVGGDLRARLPADRSSLPKMRALLAGFLEASDLGDEVSYNAQLVMHELAANAIEHGSDEQDDIEVVVQLLRNRLSIVVYDNARRNRVPVALTPDGHRDHGRGLQVVDQLAQWSEQVVGGRRKVCAQLPL
jgi:anti-sigma regulatory factor (Ser/Thr protein kinase)